MAVDPTTALVAVGAGLLRSVAGWLENSLEDGKISQPEWKLLGATVVKYVAYVVLLSLGLDMGQAVAGALVLDKVGGLKK